MIDVRLMQGIFLLVFYAAILAGVLIVIGVDTNRIIALIAISSVWMIISYFIQKRLGKSHEPAQTSDDSLQE